MERPLITCRMFMQKWSFLPGQIHCGATRYSNFV